METKDQENLKDTSNSKTKKTFAEYVEVFKFVLIFLAALGTGFGAGVTAYTVIVDLGNREIVPKGCCIPKEDLAGKILKAEAIREIDYLIEIGEQDNTKNNDAETRIWLSRVLAFIHGLDIEIDSEWNGLPMSAVEADIRYVFLDPSIEIQRQKTLGILQGFKASFQTRVTNP